MSSRTSTGPTPGTLDFIDHMLEWSRNVPILIVTLARPELLETPTRLGRRPPELPGARPRAARGRPDARAAQGPRPGPSGAGRPIDRRPRRGHPAVRRRDHPDARSPTAACASADDGRFEPVGELGELAVPDTLHALIAARLDGLEPADRTLVQDAAVLGQSFTPAGLAAVSGLEDAVPSRPPARARPSGSSTEERDPRSPERGKFAFVQALIREVAYSTLRHARPPTRHLAAARFFESLGDDELAGALAAHYLAAYRAATDGPRGRRARHARRGSPCAARPIGPRPSAARARRSLPRPGARGRDGGRRTGGPPGAEPVPRRPTAARNDAAPRDSWPERRRSASDRATGPRSREAVGAAGRGALRLRGSASRRSRMLEPASRTLGDLADDPVGVRLIAQPCRYQLLLTRRLRGLAATDRALAAAERLGMVEIAARGAPMKGAIAEFQGRHWEAIALPRRRPPYSPSSTGSPSIAIAGERHAGQHRSRSTIHGRPSPSSARSSSSPGELGRREPETVTARQHGRGRRAGPATGTGSFGELERAIRSTRSMNVTRPDSSRRRAGVFRILRGDWQARSSSTSCSSTAREPSTISTSRWRSTTSSAAPTLLPASSGAPRDMWMQIAE